MAKIPFDIKYRDKIESGEYKVMFDCGVEAEILAWDKPGEYPIVCMAKKEGAIPFRTDNNGNAYHYPEYTNYSDLFIITPDPELSEFESKVKYIVDNLTNNITYRNVMKERFNRGDEDEQIKEYASELLTIARKEVVHNIADSGLDSLAHKIGYQKGFEDGKEEALKDLPRWKISLPEPGKRYVLLFNGGSIVETRDYRRGNFYYEDGEHKNIEYNPKCVRWMYAEELYQLPGGFKED